MDYLKSFLGPFNSLNGMAGVILLTCSKTGESAGLPGKPERWILHFDISEK